MSKDKKRTESRLVWLADQAQVQLKKDEKDPSVAKSDKKLHQTCCK